MEENISRQKVYCPYNEVYGILTALGNNFINKIPKEILNNITRNLTYTISDGKKIYDIPTYDFKVSLNIQGVSKEAIAIIYYLYYNFWCNTDKEKEYLKNVIRNNERKLEEIKRENYGDVDIFKKKNNQDEKMLTPVKEEKWYEKLLKKIKNIFKS